MIFALESAAYAFAAWRLFALGLSRKQPALTAFLLFRSLAVAAASISHTGSASYFWFYIGFTSLNIVLAIFASREAIALVLDEYPGLRSVGRQTVYGAIAVALVSAFGIGHVYWRSDVTTNLYLFQVANRSLMFGLTVILIALVWFLSRYPLDLTRNRVISTFAFGSLFLSEAITQLADTLAPHLVMQVADQAGSLVASLCLFSWGLLLSREGEIARPARGYSASEEHLLRQLQNLERAASRITRG